MTNTFEDQLREDLHAATSHTAYGSIDPAQIIGEGSRLVRRRRRQRGLGAVAAVAVLAVGGFLATDHGRTTTAPPAGPSTPVVEKTALPAGSGIAIINVTQPRNRQFVVEVVPGPADQADVSYYEVDLATQARTLLGRSSTRGLGDGATWGTSDDAPGIVIGLMPQHAYGAVPLFGRDVTGGVTTDVDTVTGTPYQAFLHQFDDPASVSSFQGMVWSMPDQTIHGPGGELPVAGFPGSDALSGARVWVAPQQKVFGLDRMGIEATTPITEDGPFSVQFSSTLEGDTEQGVIFGLVERGSTDVSLKVTRDTTITRPVSLASVEGTDHDAFYAEVTGPKGKVRLLEVSWTDPAGHQQRHVVSRD